MIALSRVGEAASWPGLSGVLELAFAWRRGRTVLLRQREETPLRVIRPFPLQDGRLFVQLINSTAGILAGDTNQVHICVERGAKVVVLSQSATKVFGMPDGRAEETIRLEVESEGELEFYPGLVIPFPASDFRQRIEVELQADARFGLLESWAMGRIERGEELAFHALSSRVAVNQAGRALYRDALELSPTVVDLNGPGLLEGHRYLAAGYWNWDTALPPSFCNTAELQLLTGLPARGHLYLRALARDGLALRTGIGATLSRQRSAWGLGQVPFLTVRA